MLHTCSLQETYFNAIKNKTKIYEIRLFDEKRKKINIGDELKFICNNKYIITQITEIQLFDTFNDALDDNLDQIIPQATKEEALKIYYDIYGKDYIYKVVKFKLNLLE